jgi:hypothetical protein
MYMYNWIFRSFDFYQGVFETFEFDKKMTVMVCYPIAVSNTTTL